MIVRVSSVSPGSRASAGTLINTGAGTYPFFCSEELPWQAHALALCAVARAAAVNFSVAGRWHGMDLRLLTIGFVVLALYVLAWLIRLPEDWRRRNYHHAYTWTASVLAAWLLWYELQPVAVSVGFAGMGLLLLSGA